MLRVQPEPAMRQPLAVLIDAENISSALFDPLKSLVEAIGVPIVWQLHGDFFSWPHPGWQEVAQREGIELRHQFHAGKNSADIAMTIAAMDLLHGGKVKGFCIGSSDRDFTALVRRLRSENMVVYGFGSDKANESYRKAFTEFHVLHMPLPLMPAATERGLDQLDIKRLHELLHTVCREAGTNGRVLTATAATFIKINAPDLAERVGGAGKFLKALKALDLVQIHEEGPQRWISVKFNKLAVVGR
ncbi:MAG: NYN domain-containing protein [Hyphomicrobiales bacterium]|nr:MAG: NYN domain-containing protein [Hyphomicrobiales bacterium]